MATIDSLSGKSISEKSTEELLEHLRQMRKRRRIPKQKPKASKKRKAPPKDTVNGMTKEQAEALLKKLGG